MFVCMKIFYTILIIVLLAGAGTVLLWQCQSDWCLIFGWQRNRIIDSFEKCAAAGNPIMESYPRQCAAGGKTFTEIISVGNDKIKVEAPLSGALVKSPLKIKGQARGTWYFEASFPVKLLDGSGREIAVVPAQAQGEWMTENWVPFEAMLEFAAPETELGLLILEKDNPSGLPENADSISLPVRFR